MILSALTYRAKLCHFSLNDFCAGVPISQCKDPLFTRLVDSQTISFSNYHIISFSDFEVRSGGGIAEGRLAVRNNFVSISAGYSIGSGVNNQPVENPSEVYSYFSLVVGNNVDFLSGSIHPDATNGNTKENVFVGGTMTSEQGSLLQRRTGGCNVSEPYCLGDDFANAQNYYIRLSAAFAR